MKIERKAKINAKVYMRALKFINRKGKVELVISHTKSLRGKWHDNEKKACSFRYLKSKEILFTARALVIGKHKFSLLVAN